MLAVLTLLRLLSILGTRKLFITSSVTAGEYSSFPFSA